ncbi:MAG: hypothetical protein DRP64_03950, partial [Verrucomicrobia bacterium]
MTEEKKDDLNEQQTFLGDNEEPQNSIDDKTEAPAAKPPQQQRHSPQHQDVLKQQALEQQEVKEVLVFLQKYAKPAAIAIVVICVVVLADKFFKAQRHKKEAMADTALMHAQGTADLQSIVDDYASTPSGPLALMELAR